MKEYDVIILGGGAAGLMCAIAAGSRGRRVLVLEGSNKIGKKILMSGGGRCNFTNLHCEPANFLSANPAFCISALSRYTPSRFLDLVEEHDIAYHEKTAGQLFCDRSSKDILAMLNTECCQFEVDICLNCNIRSVSFNKGYTVENDTEHVTSKSLVVASGGLSIPKMGASDFGYRLARQFGISIKETRPALVPFTFRGAMQDLAERLSGVSVRVRLRNGAAEFTDNILFTHRGMSGPAALQMSNYWTQGQRFTVDLFPDTNVETLLLKSKRERPGALLRTVLAEALPRALVLELQTLFWQKNRETPLAELADNVLQKLANQLHQWTIRPAATEGYRTAEVTLGGIDTDELSSKTMECKRQPGLFFVGEVVDVTGQLGGHNFQWAWASAQAAGQVA